MSDHQPAPQGDNNNLHLQESAATDIIVAASAVATVGLQAVQTWATVRTMSASTLEPTDSFGVEDDHAISLGVEDDLEYRPGPDAEYRVGPEAFGVYDWGSDL